MEILNKTEEVRMLRIEECQEKIGTSSTREDYQLVPEHPEYPAHFLISFINETPNLGNIKIISQIAIGY